MMRRNNKAKSKKQEAISNRRKTTSNKQKVKSPLPLPPQLKLRRVKKLWRTSKSKNTTTKILLLILIFSLAVLFWQMHFQKNGKRGNNIDREQGGKVLERCSGGKLYQNKEQGYEVCYPGGWSYREFGEAKETVGFDERPIPTATEYMGRFIVRATDKNISEVKDQLSSVLVGLKEEDITVDGVDGKKIEGTIFSAVSFFAGQNEMVILLEKEKRFFQILFINTADEYIKELPLFLDFVQSFSFSSITPYTTKSEDGSIVINSPLKKALAVSPLNIRGKIKNGNTTVFLSVSDGEGNRLGQTSILVKPVENEEYVSFFGSLLFEKPADSAEGKLRVYQLAKDGKEKEAVEIPLKFR